MLEQIEESYVPEQQTEAREREFFGGIVAGNVKTERLRRLAVLCFLHRGKDKPPALKVADLERITRFTREELSSTLWYLREKNWVKAGESGEYRITDAGTDVIQNKLDAKEAEICRAWLAPEDTEPAQPVSSPVPAAAPPQAEQTAAAPAAPEQPAAQQAAQQPLVAEPTQAAAEIGKPAVPGQEQRAAAASQPTPAAQAPEQPTPAAQAPEQPTPAAQAPEQPTPAPSAPAPPAAIGPVAVQPPKETIHASAAAPTKRVILSMGGKGGVGKTSVMTGLAEWFDENQIPVTLLDLDTENKACGSLAHFFGGRVPKINIHTPAGLDAFVDHLDDDTQAILADMGAGSGQVTYEWFEKMYPDVAEIGVAFTAIGVVTDDPASVESILAWAQALENRVDYVIVENKLSEHSDFTYWRENEQVQEFRQRFQPAVIRMDCRLADLENTARKLGVTMGRVAGRNVAAPEIQKASLVMRAQSYRRRMSAEFDKVRHLLVA